MSGGEEDGRASLQSAGKKSWGESLSTSISLSLSYRPLLFFDKFAHCKILEICDHSKNLKTLCFVAIVKPLTPY